MFSPTASQKSATRKTEHTFGSAWKSLVDEPYCPHKTGLDRAHICIHPDKADLAETCAHLDTCGFMEWVSEVMPYTAGMVRRHYCEHTQNGCVRDRVPLAFEGDQSPYDPFPGIGTDETLVF